MKRGSATWNQQLNACVNKYVRQRVASKKRKYEKTYRRVKRGTGYVEFGQPIEPGRRVKQDKMIINAAFYVDRSGSMSGRIDNVFTAIFDIADGLTKSFRRETVVEKTEYRSFVFNTQMQEIDWGKKVNANGNTMDFEEILEKIVAEYKLPQSDLPFAEFIRNEFKAMGESNMKFYKMSDMSKALYIAVENLLNIEGFNDIDPKRRAIILANKSASLDADVVHQEILNKHLPEGASPAAFVYTLANVSAGEMCIRHKIQGDNTFFIENQDSGFTAKYARNLIENNKADAVLYGWCEYLKGRWNVNVKLLKSI